MDKVEMIEMMEMMTKNCIFSMLTSDPINYVPSGTRTK
jgi:hypothetical protein